jgi:F-type H+-transporting ATPase subunit alpha
MKTQHAALLDKINSTGDYNDEIEKGLRAAIEAFKKSNVW